MELPADFLSLERGSIKLVLEHKYTIDELKTHLFSVHFSD